MRLFGLDIWIGVTFVVLGLGGLAVVHTSDHWLDAGEARLFDEVAHLKRGSGQVRLRTNESMFWREISGDSLPLGGGEAVFTGADSTAELDFLDGGTAELSPNTLVLVDTPPENSEEWKLKWLWRVMAEEETPRARLDIREGEVRLKTPPDSRPVEVVTRDGVVRVGPKENQAAELLIDAIAGREKPRIRIVNLGDTPVHIGDEGGPVLEPGAERRLDGMSGGPSGSRVAEAPDEDWRRTKLPATDPRGRASSGGGKGDTAEALSLSAELIPESLKTGRAKNRMSFAVEVTWPLRPQAAGYRVAVRGGGAETLAESETADSRAILQFTDIRNKALRFEWSALGPDGKRILAETGTFRISVPPPLPSAPADGGRMPASALSELRWAASPLADSYVVQIATDRRFHRVTQYETSALSFRPRELPAGEYHWRVRAASPLASSPWSGARRFEVRGN